MLGAASAAASLAKRAEQARREGQIVRAYLLYSEAAALEPRNSHYVSNRDALAPAAGLMTKLDVQSADVKEDIARVKEEESHRANPEPPVEMVRRESWQTDPDLQPPPVLEPNPVAPPTFDLRGDERALFSAVTAAYGLRATFDPQMDLHSGLHFAMAGADFHTVMEALAAATGTFTFAVSPKHIFVARNSEEKRNAYEPQILLNFQLPNALDQKDLVEAANAVRTVLNIRSIGWDSTSRTVMIRDRTSRARIAYSLLEAVLLPKPQVSLSVQILTVDTQKTYRYGLALPTSYQFAYFGTPGGFKSVLPDLGSALKFVTFGGGASLFGMALADSTLFASYTSASTNNLFDAIVNVSNGQTATLHVGDQYPIAQSIYTGFSQGNASIYNPAPQINFVDLGVVIKVTPKVGGAGDIALDVEADYKALGTQVFNTVPSILERQFKGSVNLREGESAVIAGLDVNSESFTRSGLPGLSQMPGVREALSDNSRDKQTSRTLVVIKPVLKSLPLTAELTPQFYLGPVRGRSVLF